MDESVIEDEDLPLERKSLIPGRGFFLPDEIQREREDREVQNRVEGKATIVITDSDADGLGSAALIREVHGDAGIIPVGPNTIADGLRRAVEFSSSGAVVYVCDLCPDRYSSIQNELDDLLDHASEIHWLDHHQWDDALASEIRSKGVELVIGDSERECTVDVIIRALDYEFDEQHQELAAVTRDHDLWIKEDARSEDIADYAHWAEDRETYVETVRKHGVDLPTDVRDFLEERRVEKQALIERAIDRAEIRELGKWRIGITYGRCSQNEVAEALRREGCDGAAIIKPSGAISIRGSEDFELAHEVAGELGGGGHPKAAGCKPDIYDDMLDYAQHWVTQGAASRREVIAAFKAVANR
ncbi:MAG: DHH family phosphoesterase [Halobacteriaceae archaeon]